MPESQTRAQAEQNFEAVQTPGPVRTSLVASVRWADVTAPLRCPTEALLPSTELDAILPSCPSPLHSVILYTGQISQCSLAAIGVRFVRS